MAWGFPNKGLLWELLSLTFVQRRLSKRVLLRHLLPNHLKHKAMAGRQGLIFCSFGQNSCCTREDQNSGVCRERASNENYVMLIK